MPAVAWLAGCAATPPANAPATAKPASTVPATSARPVREVTDFTDGLRCTDDLMLKFGTRDLVVVLEDVKDKTGHEDDKAVRIPAAGAREMLISAISDMTKRSRAVRLVAGPGDARNLTELIDAAKRDSPFRIVPQYAWRGAFTQFDADVETKRSLLGVFFAKITNIGAETQDTSSAIAMDASIVRTSDLTVIPTTVSRNVLILSRRNNHVGSDVGTGDDSSGPSALLGKFGITYSFQVSAKDALAQSSRALVELAAIETVGRLAQVPYWKCLGADESSPDVQREIEDWYLGMQNDGRLAGWTQEVLRTKRRFDGPVDGEPSRGFNQALVQARKDLSLPPGDSIDLPLFRDLISDKLAIAPKPALAAGNDGAIELVPSIAAGPPGAALSLEIDSRRDQYVYCYQRNNAGAIERIFPNRFHPDPMLAAQRRIELPGTDPFRLTLGGGPGDKANFACIASPIEVYNELGPKLRWGDFHPIGFKSFDEMRSAFEQAAGTKLGYVERQVLVSEH